MSRCRIRPPAGSSEIVSAEAGKSALRVSVEGGGCSGFSYKFDLDDQPGDDDIVLEK
jgi:Fe-S cluster assembly iron-binding protein IscA